MGPALQKEGIGYRHLPALGGRRSAAGAKAPSHNTLWREAAFQAYSDYAETDEFQTGFDQPLLHTMYVDKILLGLAAVQTRIHVMLGWTLGGRQRTSNCFL